MVAGEYTPATLRKEDEIMKDGIHPEYKDTIITCACGEVIDTRSTKQNMKVDICSKCHPFFTGKQKLVDSAGRVDRFKKRYDKVRIKKAVDKKAEKKEAKPATTKQNDPQKTDQPTPEAGQSSG
jgi:large subunit ribosomal protein L31